MTRWLRSVWHFAVSLAAYVIWFDADGRPADDDFVGNRW